VLDSHTHRDAPVIPQPAFHIVHGTDNGTCPLYNTQSIHSSNGITVILHNFQQPVTAYVRKH